MYRLHISMPKPSNPIEWFRDMTWLGKEVVRFALDYRAYRKNWDASLEDAREDAGYMARTLQGYGVQGNVIEASSGNLRHLVAPNQPSEDEVGRFSESARRVHSALHRGDMEHTFTLAEALNVMFFETEPA
jgi:hypothetical protein